jgi:predicted MFS family arabinose efflux permease
MIFSIFSASYKMVLHASQMLLVKSHSWGLTEAACTTGFRIGMIASGAGALYLSTFLSWKDVYRIMILLCIPSLIVLIFNKLPSRHTHTNTQKYLWNDAFIDFFSKKDWLIIIIFILLYRLQDDFLGRMPNIFFREMGFSKEMISISYKLGGLLAVSIGGFLGGYLCLRWKYRTLFFWSLLLHGISGWTFLILQDSGENIWLLYIVVSLQEFTKGLTLSPFFSYQLATCTKKFCITQIAILTSIVGLPHVLLGGLSGFIATSLGWTWFFIFSNFLSIPALIFVQYIPEYKKKKNI